MKNLKLITILMLLSTLIKAQDMKFIFDITSVGNITGTQTIYYSKAGGRAESEMKVPQLPQAMKNVYIFPSANPTIMQRIDDFSKTYYEMPIDKKNDVNRKYTIKRIGEETILGYKTVHVQITSDDMVIDQWNTRDIAGYEQMVRQMNAFSQQKESGSNLFEELKKASADGFTVKMQTGSLNRKEQLMTMTLVKVEKGSWPAEFFKVPDGYTKSESNQDIMKMMNMNSEQRRQMMMQMQMNEKGEHKE